MTDHLDRVGIFGPAVEPERPATVTWVNLCKICPHPHEVEVEIDADVVRAYLEAAS